MVNVDATEVKSVKKSSNEEITENNIFQAVRFHRGTDGKMRVLCGPEISDTNKLVWRPKKSSKRCLSVACSDRSKSRIHTWYRSSTKELYPFDVFIGEQPCHVMHVRFGERKEIKKDFAPAKVEPNFRTPPRRLNV